jgi:hypothetical protein
MGGDEVVAWIVAGIVALVAAFRWYGGLLRVTRLGTGPGPRAALASMPVACLGLIVAVLVLWSARDVRTDVRYILLFLTAGAAWMGVAGWLFGFLGISARDDALEARNGAAAWVVGGGLVGVTLSYAGGNVGEGPTIWNTFETALAATAVLFALWLSLELSVRVSEAVTVERDAASGVRMAGWLVGSGIILGRAGAGNWESTGAMLRDLAALGWPAALLTAAAGILHLALRPTPSRSPRLLAMGLVPAAAFVSASVIYVIALGRW